MADTARALLAAVMVTVGLVVVDAAPASADTSRCLARAPTSTTDYQTLTDSRDANFGVGDVTSMAQLPDGRRFFALGDTAYYRVNPDGSAGALQSFGTNSAWVQSVNCFTLLNRAGPGSRSWVLPPQQDGSFYWPGASVVVGSRVYVFMQRLVRNGGFGRSLGAAVAVFDLPSLRLARISPIPWSPKRVFGSGAVYDGGYIYAYAPQQRTCGFCFAGDMYVGRVPENQINVPSAWRFRSGSGWVADSTAATPVLSAAVSNTDVQPFGNGFLLITKTVNLIGPPVEAWWAPNPVGPWQDLGTVYSVPTPPPARVPGFVYGHAYTYNAVVLPTIRFSNGSVLGTYNVGTFDPSESQHDGLMLGPRFISVALPRAPAAAVRPPSSPGPSPWSSTSGVDRAGRVTTVGGGVGSARAVTTHAVAVAPTPTARGGWIASASGGVYTYGDAQFYGSMGGVRLNQPIVGMASTPTGHGYWLVARDGGIFAFGDARFRGSTGNIKLNRPILAMATSPTGSGYWFVASDGGIFAFGDARFLGSTGGAPPGFPVSGMAATPDGRGYWLMTVIGQVYSFGTANYEGNAPLPLAAVAVGIVAAPGGYRIVDAAGNVFVRAATKGHIGIPTHVPLVAAG
ncbi:MAG TPA: hypothetical protein VGP92_08840 [Acidimicrobiia bacterium]|nr:hypothetical protein [Acidimicrobiia bacterium]